jgi:superfamily II DNA or RNA helicase
MYDASELVYALEEEIGKTRFYKNQLQATEVDIYMQSKKADGNDFIIEVKNWAKPVTKAEVEKFIALKAELQPHLKANTGFIFYSYKPLSQTLADLLKVNEIMIMYGK